mmetsp:Transcript_98140/g.246062  ORF Transcript_98140/g.246062 Transcript_98140/m.246062 type:complete len:314 (-) Transcript_98140:45-986(-)
MWDDRDGAPTIPGDLLAAAACSPPPPHGALSELPASGAAGQRHRPTALAPAPALVARPVVVKLAETDPLQALAKSRAAAASVVAAERAGRAEEQPKDAKAAVKGFEELEAFATAAQLPPSTAPVPSSSWAPPSLVQANTTLEEFLAEPRPPVAAAGASAAAPSAASPPSSGLLQWRLGRLVANIVTRKEIDKLTWYSIEFKYDGVEKVCHKRYKDFVEFDRVMRQQYPALCSCLPQLPPSGVVGLRHKLDLGSFNHRRQIGLQQYLDLAIERAGEQPVRRFLQAANGVPAESVFPPCATSWEEKQRLGAQGGC